MMISIMDRNHMENYLQQQQMVLYQSDNISMDDFKSFVRKWFELDNYIKKLQEVIKEKRSEKIQISEVIMRFMCKHNIEDLNTKEGRIRCKSTQVKAPVSKNVVKQRLSDIFAHDEERKQEVLQKIYDERETKEKVTLRRLKIS